MTRSSPEQFNLAVLNALSAQVAVLDETGTIVAMNRAWERFGLEENSSASPALAGVNYLDVCRRSIAAGDFTAIAPLECLTDLLAGRRETCSIEYACPSATRCRWFLMHAARLPAEIGGVVVTHVDITERREAEDALRRSQSQLAEQEERTRQSESRLREAQRLAHVGSFEWDLATREAKWSDEMSRIHGLAGDAAPGMDTYFQFIPQPDRDLAIQVILHAERTGEPFAYNHEVILKNGARRSLDSRGVVIRDSNGKPSRIFGTSQDVTARRQADEERRRTGQMLEAVINASSAAIVVIDRQKRVKLWNPAAERIFGWSAAEVLDAFIPVVPQGSQDAFHQYLDRIFDGEIITGTEVRRLRKDGTMADISVWSARLLDRDGNCTGVAGIMSDITESKRLKEQLVQSQRIESIGRLAGGVAHDFNNLLAIISGYSEALLRRCGPSDPMREPIAQIEKAAERGSALTRQLLTFSRGDKIALRALDLNEIVSSVHTLLHRVLSDDIQLQLRPGTSLKLIEADEGQLEQVLMNLALNARDAMPDGGCLTIETANVLRHPDGTTRSPREPCVKLSVSDTGLGMDEQTRLHVFEPFFTTKDRKGTGLGLWIVYGIVERCGGSISVRSEPGKGTVFELFFPVKAAVDTADSMRGGGG